MRLICILIATFWPGFCLAGLEASPALQVLEREGPYQVTAVVDGDTVVLEDGREVRLVGIQAPKLPLGRKNFKIWPLAAEAKQALVDLTLGRDVELGYGGRRMDRHGRVLAHLIRDDGLWVQGQMLEDGWARVYTFADNRALVAAMLARETAARQARRAIWRLDFYAVLSPEQSADAIDSYALIEGRVTNAAEVRGRGYLNYGDDWREDFTVTLAPKVLRRLKSEGFDLFALEGRRLRVRGWLKSFNGPMIELTHPEQIEELDE